MSTSVEVSNAALWFALLGGPAAWTAHLLISYPLVPLACEIGTTTPLNLVTGVTALLAAAAGVVGWRARRRLPRVPPAEGEARFGRARFMALSGMVLGLFFTLVVLVEGLPPVLADPCLRGMGR